MIAISNRAAIAFCWEFYNLLHTISKEQKIKSTR